MCVCGWLCVCVYPYPQQSVMTECVQAPVKRELEDEEEGEREHFRKMARLEESYSLNNMDNNI